MADNKESFQENLMMRRAKRRLFGAVIILIILFVLSIFFLQDRTSINFKNPIKISFLEKNNNTMIDHYNFKPKNLSQPQLQTQSQDKKLTKAKQPQNFISDKKYYFIQVGMFSDELNASRLLSNIKSLGYDARLEMIKMSGKDKLKLTTTAFDSKTDALKALSVLNNANLPGIIKRK